MPSFRFTARQSNGELLKGVIDAQSRQHALGQLTRQGTFPVKVELLQNGPFRRRVSQSKMMSLYAMLADLLDSGVDLLRGLEILEQQTTDVGLKQVIAHLRKEVADGRALSAAASAHPRVFSPLAISMMNAGEEGGFLPDSLSRLAKFNERCEEIRGKVLGAMAYPAFLLLTGSAVLIGMLAFFVPKFTPMFESMRSRGQLPLATRGLLVGSQFVQMHFWWLLLLILALSFGGGWLWTQPKFRRSWDRFRLQCPGLGPVVRSLAISRFCRILGTLLQNGVGLLKSLSIAKDATGNLILSEAIATASSHVSSGKTLAAPLATCGQFPAEVLELITVAERSNRLESALLGIADKWEQRTHRKLDSLMKLIEPGLMLVMALFVGLMVIALLLPIFDNPGGFQ